MSSPSVWKQQASFYKDRTFQLQDQVEGLKGLNRVLSNNSLELEKKLQRYVDKFGFIEDEPSEDDVTKKDNILDGLYQENKDIDITVGVDLAVEPSKPVKIAVPKVSKGKSSKKSK